MGKKKKKPVVIPSYCGFTDKEMFGLYRLQSSPWYWRAKAEQLKYSADILLPKAMGRLDKISASLKKKDFDFGKLNPDTFSTVEGLLGFSLECLFKAVIIRDNPHFMDDGAQDPCMQTHNLLELAEIGKISLTQEERHVCKVFTECMYVDFRYPIDKQIREQRGILGIGKSIFNVANDLFAKIHPTVDQFHFVKGGAASFKHKSSNLRVAVKKYKVKKKTKKAKKKK